MASASAVTRLSTGAEMRLTGPTDGAAVVCVNGGQSAPVEGTWSASLEWLVGRLAPRFPTLAFAEVRYRIKSWRRLDWCEEDARAAVAATGSSRTLLLGFSMGGAVAVQGADAPGVEGVLGLAPWLPDRLPLDRLRGRRLDVVHGRLDGRLPGVPGVSPVSSRRGFDRARSLGIEGSYTVISGAVHGVALRTPLGVVPLPRAGRWAELAAERVGSWAA
jgi:pimeloyl-ACP methyl ester carboxylesterase